MKFKLAAVAVGTALLITPVVALARTAGNSGLSTQATVNQQIPLKPRVAFSRATGSAQYQAQPGQREFQVEIDRLASLTGSPLLVQVSGAKVGWMTVSNVGIAQLNRNSELGQRVPVILHGSTVTVKTRAGIVIASGSF